MQNDTTRDPEKDILTAALPMSVSTLFEMKSTITLRRRKPALIVFSLAILLLIPTATASEGWIKTYQGESMDVLTPSSIIQSSDGGFAVTVSGMLRRVDNVGYEGHFTTTFELQIIKMDSNGQIQWKLSYPQIDDPNHTTPTIHTESYTHTIIQTTDQGYAITSSSGYTGWIVKIDSQGAVLWAKTYTYDEESTSSNLYGIIQANDGGFALAGSTWTSEGGQDFWLIKTDSKGNLQWQQKYNSGNYVDNLGNQYPQDEEAKCVIQTQDGGYALSGSVLLFRASTGTFVSATWVVKTDAQGKLSWSKGYDLLNEAGSPQTIIQTIDNGYAIAGTENTNFCLFKISSSGQMQWSKTYDDERTNTLSSLIQLNDGGYALAGTGTAEDYYIISLLRADSSGQTNWIKTFNAKQDSTIKSNDIASAMILSSDGSYVLTGSTLTQSETHQDVLVIKTEKLEEPPTATPTVMPATEEPLNPDTTLSPSATSTEPNNTGHPDNSQTANPNTENAFNTSTTWIGLTAGITIVFTVSSAILLIKKSKKQKSS